ncbi:hypothetical protein quinque_010910 [Culex quinquefasciatus]
MPRIDPLKLLTCLSVLLAPNGGIRSANEVKRLANLMAKFSKKLVSKCIYIQILKCTETDLLGQFMAAGGWSLVHMWLADGITTKNWPLIQELLELLLCCPVDVERLKSNTAPKLVKSLSKDSSHEGVRLLATKLVEQWLKIARNDIRSGQVTVPASATVAPPASAEAESSNDEPAEEQAIADQSQEEIVSETVVDEEEEEEEEGGETIVPDVVPAENGGDDVSEEVDESVREDDDGDHEEEEDVEGAKDDFNKAVADSNAKKAPLLFKITMKNGKQVLAKVESPTKKSAAELEDVATKGEEDAAEDVSKVEDAKKEVADEQLDQTDSVESVDSVEAQKVKDEKSEKSKDKDRRKSDEKDRSRDKDKSSSKDKDKHRDKDKKSSSSSSHRPKTVKTYNANFRSHGLTEEAPPPPSRKGLKKPSSGTTTAPVQAVGSTATGTVPTKRSSPTRSSKDGPPEKKTREEPTERPGAIKLIPAKRQPSLVESDMFMDALSATLKKDVKKRKRRHSGSEGGAKGTEKPASTATTPTTELDKSITEPASPEKTEKATPPASPTSDRPESPVVAPAVTAAVKETPSPAVPAPASPEKVTVAPMSFYRDTLADSDEPSEAKKEDGEDGDAKVKEEKAATDETAASEDVEMKAEEIPDTPAEPEDDDEEVIKKPKRLKSELNDDEDVDDKSSLLDVVSDDLSKKMANIEDGIADVPEIPVKKPPGPGCGPDGPPGVLVIHRRKGPKKQLKWKAQDDLEEVRYFELDVTERCNVTKTFTDLKHMERVDERNKYMLSRKLPSEDIMMERTAWLPLIEVDNVPPHPDGVNSQERNLQRNRERSVLQALYFNRHMIPDSPAEPDVEVYSISEPIHIPMDDVTGNPDSVNDFTSMPWPEPKSTPPHESAGFNSPFFPGSGNDFPPFGNAGSWDMPGSSTGPFTGMFPTGRMPPGVPPPNVGGHGPPNGNPNMMRPMNMPPNMPPMVPPNMPPHPNMFPNNFAARGPPPPIQQHMNDRDMDDNFRNGPPPPPAWMNNNNGGPDRNRGPPPGHQGNFNNNNRGNFGGGRGGGGGNWNNNRDNDRSGPRGGNYRPPWLQNNRGNNQNHGSRGRKW